jgi:hypothetical protein
LNQNDLKNHDKLYKYIIKKFNFQSSDIFFMKTLKLSLRQFCDRLYLRWQKAWRKKTVFLKNNNDWLQKDWEFQKKSSKVVNPVGRPLKSFNVLSDRSKRRRTQNYRAKTSLQEVAFASSMQFKSSNHLNGSKQIKLLIPTNENAENEAERLEIESANTVPVANALAFVIDGRLSKKAYYQMTKQLKEVNNRGYPPYCQIVAEKKECYPPVHNTHVSNNGAEIELQAILDLTLKRLCTILRNIEFKNGECLKARYKWGCDGSSGHNKYKQKLPSTVSDSYDESSVFISTFVLLDVYSKSENKLIWRNAKASSNTGCRPIKFEYIKETPSSIRQHVLHIEDQIDKLLSTEITFNNPSLNVTIEHEMHCTMIDGKVIYALTNTKSTQSCYICGKSSKEMNDLNLVKPPNEEFYKYGMSSLHAWIRTFECFLKIAYKLPAKCWRYNAEIRPLCDKRKKEIQHAFKTEIGLIVDQVKPGKCYKYFNIHF